jgi:hypothetical protein
MAALMRIADFVHDTGMGKHIASSLLELVIAISELEDGIANPILAPRKLKSRAPVSGFIWIERARLVSAYELLLASGLRSSAAIKRIQEYGNAFDPLLEHSQHRGLATLVHSLQSWRKAFKEGKVASPLARSRYKRAMERVDAAKKLATPTQIDEFARHVLEAGKVAVANLTIRKDKPSPYLPNSGI